MRYSIYSASCFLLSFPEIDTNCFIILFINNPKTEKLLDMISHKGILCSSNPNSYRDVKANNPYNPAYIASGSFSCFKKFII